MTRYALLLEPQRHDIQVTCAIVGNPEIHYGTSKTFSDVSALRSALHEARISNVSVNTAVETLAKGFNSFAFIDQNSAQALELLLDPVQTYKDKD